MTLITIALLLYFVPSVVAVVRHHRNRSAIEVVNFFLGWTLIGWVVALAWASTDNVKREA